MGYVIVEGDSLALFTALKNSPRNVIFDILTAYKAYKIGHFVGLKKRNATTIVVSFYESAD